MYTQIHIIHRHHITPPYESPKYTSDIFFSFCDKFTAFPCFRNVHTLHMLICIALLTLSAIDPLQQKPMENTLMRLFIRDMKPRFRHRLTDRDPDCCAWSYAKRYESAEFTCTSGKVTGIAINWVRAGNFRLHCLPNSIVNLRIACCGQSYRINTRQLPSQCQIASLRSNVIHGTVNFETLPCRLRELDLSHNRIHGPVHLFRLPRSLERLDLKFNSITESTVYTPTADAVNFDFAGNKIGEIVSYSEEEARAGKVKRGSKRLTYST